jgi:hypothetical protein
MADALQSKEVTLDGRGALVSNVSTFLGDDSNFTTFLDLITDNAGRIRKRVGKGVAKGTAAASRITQMHEYVFTNATSWRGDALAPAHVRHDQSSTTTPARGRR